VHFLYLYCCEGRYFVYVLLKCPGKSGNLIMIGEWPPCMLFFKDDMLVKLQKIDAAKEYYQRKVDFLTQQMEKLQSVLREKFDMKEGDTDE